MRRVLAAAAVAFALVSGSAAADTVTVRPLHDVDALKMTRRTTGLVTDAARAAFPVGACAGRVHWIFNATSSELDPDLHIGQAIPEGCVILVGPLQEFRDACIVASHEMGHLAGLDHSPNEHDLMYENPMWGSARTPQCDAARRLYRKRRR